MQITTEVIEMGQMNIRGHVIDDRWYQELTFENGKPNLAACLILAEIRYWYTPTEVKDEQTGNIIGFKKKFKSDFLQRSYEQLSEKFGFGKDQVRNACKLLEEKELIKIEFRTIDLNDGRKANNVMFIRPKVENIKKFPLCTI